MTPSHDAPARQRYLVHAGCGRPLNDFLALARTDADITVLELVGPRDAPHTAVLELDDATAQRLQQQFRDSGAAPTDQLTIEPDRPLSMFDTGPQ
jgi:hypothetical protein